MKTTAYTTVSVSKLGLIHCVVIILTMVNKLNLPIYLFFCFLFFFMAKTSRITLLRNWAIRNRSYIVAFFNQQFLATACFARRGLYYHLTVIDLYVYIFIYLFIICNLFVYENMQVLRSLDVLGKTPPPFP